MEYRILASDDGTCPYCGRQGSRLTDDLGMCSK